MSTLYRHTDAGRRCELLDPCALPQAAGFLWNRRMMIQMNARGYAVAQFMQPEPAKYAHQPCLEAKTFMQPEQPYFAHHPGRFFYLKDEDSGALFSVPFAPVHRKPDRFVFSVGQCDLRWQIECDGLHVELSLGLPVEEVVELWSLSVVNLSGSPRRISLYSYFPVGYASWMNRGGEYRPDLGGIVCTAVAPYQKVQDYFKNRNNKDMTFLICDQPAEAHEVNQAVFEGWGGLNAPSAVTQQRTLAGGDARYETPVCALQFRRTLEAGGDTALRFIFGPAYDDAEIRVLRERYLAEGAFERTAAAYAAYVAEGAGCLQISTPDATLDNYVNHWMPRQAYYHGDVNRLTTDPQTRNFLQDAMGMAYLKPEVARAAILTALKQQKKDGAMPDGILLVEGAELKYINQVPHMDHCVWLPVALSAYLDETDDYALLDVQIPFADETTGQSVSEHIDRAMGWLLASRDARGLSYIAEGDWCDPMNMVGYKGRGVSGWLTLGTAWALRLWAGICSGAGREAAAGNFRRQSDAVNAAVNQHLWDGDWYARGITDEGVVFGVKTDPEGAIFINPQGWALLSGAANSDQRHRLIAAVENKLDTPYGLMKLAPPFRSMRDDVGRVTQKFPGTAENGSVYNHAAIFYGYGLYVAGEADRGYQVLRKMLPGPAEADITQRGQLPVFIPNYYRGAYHEYPRTAGRSSQLFNTGTVAWYYRCLVDGLFGLQGSRQGLRIAPQLPSAWDHASVRRHFRGATVVVTYQRSAQISAAEVRIDGQLTPSALLDSVVSGRTYTIEVLLPRA